VREIKAFNGGLSVYEELPGGGCEGRLFYRTDKGWSPPLPDDVALPDGLGRSTSGHSAGSISRSSTLSTRPDWLLGETESWRLR
jgi:hypothetical protein